MSNLKSPGILNTKIESISKEINRYKEEPNQNFRIKK